MRLVYVDEAGISSPEQEPFMIVAAVIVSADRDLVAVERHLDRVVERWIPEHLRHDFVFHAHELFNGTKKGSGKAFERDHPDWPLQKRLQIADDLAAIPKKFRLPIPFAFSERAKFPATPEAKANYETLDTAKRIAAEHMTTFMACALMVEHWMRTHASNEVCLMVVEDNDQSRQYIRQAQSFHQKRGVLDFLDEGARKHFPLRKIKEDPLFQKKRKSSVLQLADFCAYVFKKNMMKDDRYARFIDQMWDQVPSVDVKD